MRSAALPFAAFLALALFPAQASPVDFQAFTLVVPCSDPDGVSSAEVGDVTLTPGTYVVTVSGACDYSADPAPVETPCSTPLGAVPCVEGEVRNVPGSTCSLSFGTVHTWDCFPDVHVDCPFPGAYDDYFVVKVNGRCVDKGAGLVQVTGDYVDARFVDWRYEDNVGTLLVTFTWTPLNA